MGHIVRALRVKGILGSICGAIGHICLFAGGDLGSFTSGAMPGILLGFSSLTLLLIPR